jgi:RecA-family ATPase
MAKELRFKSWEELKNRPPEIERVLVDGLLWEKDHVIILAKEKVGKSLFAMQLACALSCGEPFLNEYNVFCPVDVCYIQTEGKESEFVERMRSMTGLGGVGAEGTNLHILCTHSVCLDSSEGP